MDISELLTDGFERVREVTQQVLAGLSVEQLTARVEPGANSIGWLVWHLSRVQDDHVADAAGIEQVWTAKGWAGRFRLPFADSATGYAQSADEVGAVRVQAELLSGYLEDVHAQTLAFVGRLRDTDLDRIVDEGWDPPVSLGARLVSVLSDDLQHAGQAAFVRGIVA